MLDRSLANKVDGRENSEDTYFLDRDIAYSVALKNNRVTHGVNECHIQHCYYEGEPFSNSPPNLIHVPLSKFTDFFTNNDHWLPTNIFYPKNSLTEEQQQHLWSTFNQLLGDIRGLRQSRTTETYSNKLDTYFFDRELARKTALQQNRVKLEHPTIDGLQICYHDGEPFENGPMNLVPVKFEYLSQFIANTRLRHPMAMVFPPNVSKNDIDFISPVAEKMVNDALKARKDLAKAQKLRCRNLTPSFDEHEPLRVFLPTTRLSTVMQYTSKDLAKAFGKHGCITRVSIEQNDMESLDNSIRLKELYEFNPHIIVNINKLSNDMIHDDVFNIVWWQDPMPEITNQQPLPWRKRDIILSLTRPFDNYLKNCGASAIHRQHFCVDTEIFRIIPEIKRQEKIVFVGSSYRDKIRRYYNEILVLDQLNLYMAQGVPITQNTLSDLAEKHNIPFDYVFWDLFHYVVRDSTVRWLCKTSTLPIEVYGRYWEQDEIVRPFFKGELPHGNDVAKVYNTAKYALVSHPFEVNSQRLAEAAACGCIPLVYDCRHSAEPPFWESECLYFKTQNELSDLLTCTPPSSPTDIATHFSYDHLVENILHRIYAEIK